MANEMRARAIIHPDYARDPPAIMARLPWEEYLDENQRKTMYVQRLAIAETYLDSCYEADKMAMKFLKANLGIEK